MKKQITLLLISLLTFSFFGQNSNEERVNLEWNDYKVVNTSEQNRFSTPVVVGHFVDENQLPIFFKTWKVGNEVQVESYTISNVQFEVVSSGNFSKSQIAAIPINLEHKLNTAQGRKNNKLILIMTPLTKEENIIRKVISFSIKYTLMNSLLTTKSNVIKKGMNSILASGEWYKFSVDTTGVFKLDRSFLQSLGMNAKNINPKNIKIYGNGGQMLPFKNSDFRNDDLQENAIFVSGEEDGKFDSSDFVLFYAQGPHNWNDGLSNSSIRHRKNIFSDKAYYFVTTSGGNGKRILDEVPNSNPPSVEVTSFNDFTFYERDDVNLFTIGQQWFGEDFSFQDSHSFLIPFNNVDGSVPVRIRVRGVVESSLTSSMSIKVNGAELFAINYPAVQLGSLTHAYGRENSAEVSLSGDNIKIEISFNNNGNPSAKAHLDYIEIIGNKSLEANGNQFGFRNFEVSNSANVVNYKIQNPDNISELWDVTNPLAPSRIQNISTASSFDFIGEGGAIKQYRVLNDSDYYTPEKLDQSVVQNQNLHNLQDVDYVIVTQDFLISQAEKLAEYHRQNGLVVEVVDLLQIYNEFSSGSPDLTGIRDFTRHLYSNASSNENRIKYLCLFGDASYDYKDRISGNNNIVPVFEAYESFNFASSYVTDDYYGMMDDTEGLLTSFDRQDVATGRIPVDNVQQANEVVAKILNYYSTNSLGDWRNNLTLVADDIGRKGEEVLQENMEEIADSIKENRPIFNTKKLYFDAYVQVSTAGGKGYPDVKRELNNAVEKGTLMVDYFGHGGEDGWAGGVLGVQQIQSWNNFNTLPLFVTITCEFTKFDNPLRNTAGEYTIWNSNGGAVSLVTTTREIYISVGQAINEQLVQYLLSFDGQEYTIAEALMLVKNKFTTNQRLFIYSIGDPAMRLAAPKPDVRITHMNGKDISQSIDTINALSHISFDGVVTNASGTIIDGFNGEVSSTIFDKEITKSTLDNNNSGIVMEFDALESKIFRGRASVENGKFSFDFIAPKDLRIAFGKGKLSFYADNNLDEKAGYSFDVTIGGINENAPEDNEGPQIQLYMNDETFVDGGNTNESPYLVGVLVDESGINTSITAVDHDIIAYLDGDRANPFVLNDYYQTDLDDFTKGKVEFPFRDLEPGLHTIELCAWDTYNNSSCASLSFIVVSDTDMVLDHVLNYPNPFVNYTEFWFNHNKPNEPLEVQVQIFTISGKLVKTLNETVQSTGNLSRSVVWNGLDDFGDKIGKGVYVYKLNVKSLLSNVKAEKYEKLVILQ